MTSVGLEPLDAPPEGRGFVSVVIPVFRNAESLRQLYAELIDVAAARFPTCGLEIVFVDDGSDDDSWAVISSLHEADPKRVSAHRLSRNFGQLSAMVAGYRLARGDAVVSISADLQDPTELIGDMVDRWLTGDDIVIANRAGRSDSKLSSTTSRLAYWYARRATPSIPEGGFDYFLMSRRAIDLLLQFKGRFRFLQGDLLWLGLPTSFIPYVRRERPHGKSGYSFGKRLSNFTDLVIDSSYGPIKAVSRAGFVIALLGFAYLITIVVDRLAGGTPFNGWAPIMVTLLILNGFVLMTLGVIGEYLWRIYDQVRERPMHIVLTSEFAQVPQAGEQPADLAASTCRLQLRALRRGFSTGRVEPNVQHAMDQERAHDHDQRDHDLGWDHGDSQHRVCDVQQHEIHEEEADVHRREPAQLVKVRVTRAPHQSALGRVRVGDTDHRGNRQHQVVADVGRQHEIQCDEDGDAEERVVAADDDVANALPHVVLVRAHPSASRCCLRPRAVWRICPRISVMLTPVSAASSRNSASSAE